MAELPLHFQTLAELARRLRSGELSPVQLTEHLLQRIGALDKRLNSYRLLMPERALAQARGAEAALRAGVDLGPLHGLPFAAKDLFDVQGYPTTAGSKVLANAIAKQDATAVRRLERAGMVLLGKTNTVEFAYGGVGINHHHGTPHNPWHATLHAPGGSSSGSGVAVAAGLAPMALGTDTGGSVRIPAALCGTVGLKTTVGRVSRAGVYPLSFSLDSVGPLTRSVEDAALVYQHLQGEDAADETTLGIPGHDVLGGLKAGAKGLRVGIPQAVFFDDVDGAIVKAVQEAGRVLSGLGAHVSNVPFEEAREAAELNPRGLMIAAEAYAVNQRFLEERFQEMDPVTRERMINGKTITGPEYFAKTRKWAELRRRVQETLRDVDVMIVPTTLIPPRPIAELDADMEVYMRVNFQYLRNTAIGNILNFCGLSLPCGFTAQGLPIGLMIYAKSFQEHLVLRAGHAFEQATDWHKRQPDLAWAGRS